MLRGIPEGQRQIGLFRAACSMRARRFHEDEARIVLRSVADASGWTEGDPDKIVSRAYVKYAVEERKDESRIWTLDELVKANLGEPDYFVHELLARGLCLVWAEPKAGKSLMVANLCLAIATGRKAWGKFDVKRPRGVLYLDLEQDEVSARKRWMLALDGYPPPENLRLAFKWNKQDRGGLDDLRAFLAANQDVEVVVIDILSNFWPSGQDTTRNSYYSEYDILQELKAKIADEYGVCLILVHHTNKAGEASGSNAMKGAPHYLFDLLQPDESNYGILRVKGKNIPQREIGMVFDYEHSRCYVQSVR
jgi:RecA-family ATPase